MEFAFFDEKKLRKTEEWGVLQQVMMRIRRTSSFRADAPTPAFRRVNGKSFEYVRSGS